MISFFKHSELGGCIFLYHLNVTETVESEINISFTICGKPHLSSLIFTTNQSTDTIQTRYYFWDNKITSVKLDD